MPQPRKSMFLKQTSDLLSLSPLGHSDGFASCKAWCVLISASMPNCPLSPVKGCVCLVGFASCKALVHINARHPCRNTGTGVPATRLGATPLRPHFQKLYRFIDSLRAGNTTCPRCHFDFILPLLPLRKCTH